MYEVSLQVKTSKLPKITLSVFSYLERAYLGSGSSHRSTKKCNRELSSGRNMGRRREHNIAEPKF